MTTSVTQKHDMACGLACVAFVSQLPYDELAAAQPAEKLNLKGFMCPELTAILNSHGLPYSWKKLTPRDRHRDFDTGDIVFVKRSTTLPYGHFLTKTSDGWMDPWINLADELVVSKAQSGFREQLPGKAEYLLYVKKLTENYSG